MMLVIILLPLIPVVLVFVKGKYEISPMHYLVLVCILDVVSGLCNQLPSLTDDNRSITRNILALLNLAALVQLFKTTQSKTVKIALNIFLIAFLSSVLTGYSILGWQQNSRLVESSCDGIILLSIFLGISPLIKDHMLQIFQSPMLYIGIGTLFYIVIAQLVVWVSPSGLITPQLDGTIILSISAIVKYTLYTQAVIVCPSQSPS